MKKFIILQCFFLATFSVVWSQNYVNFGIRYQNTIKGDMIVVGNSILNVGDYPANQDYKGTQGDNSQITLNYTNVVPETGIFNSSSAVVPDPNPSSNCKKVLKAYLYWAAAYTKERIDNQTNPKLEKSKFKNVKFKVGSGNYIDIEGEKVYDADNILSGSGLYNSQRAYVYRKEVTQYLTSINNTYTVGNIQAPYGKETTGVGYAAGWTLVIVYEDLTKPSRNVTIFDGFSVVNRNNNPTIDISGFKTVPTGPVKAKIGFAALEGELGITGDRLDMRKKNGTFQSLSAPGRSATNFFNSTITDENGVNTRRNPASENLLGFDAGIFELENGSKVFLGNNDTSTKFNPISTQDAYYPFMFAFNVEVIAPHIVMEKRVFNAAGKDVTDDTNIAFGSSLRYKIRFQNIGNDDAKDLVITDILPKSLQNKVLNVDVPTGSDITHTYNQTTRELKFTIPDKLVTKNSALKEISFGVEVAKDCNDWRDPCANVIENSVSASYNGVQNPLTNNRYKTNSFPKFGACNSGTEGPSRFTVNTDFTNCAYKETLTLCQASTVLTAADGFDSYKWEKTVGANTGQRGNNRSLTVSEAGTYKVTKTKTGCATMYEIYEVKPNPTEGDHPIYKMIENRQINGELYTCPDTGQYYPQVYLCGKDASATFKITMANAKSYVWQKKANCNAKEKDRTSDCPPSLELYACNWTDVYSDNGTTTNRSLSQEGDYRLVVTYGNGAGNCVVYYYFRITKNELAPKAEKTDIICTTSGSITIKDVPAIGYQYALLQGTTTITNYQNSPNFPINNEGTYKVLIKQTVTKTTSVPCVFEINSIFVKKREPKLKVTVTPMACANNKGGMRIELTDAPYKPYSFVIRKENVVGEIYRKDVNGAALPVTVVELTNYFDAGRYRVSLENAYGCNITETVEISKLAELKATATVLSPRMCGTGKRRVT
ncbi:DUF7619 domain-containing protein, partial [Capnocytophaga sp.]